MEEKNFTEVTRKRPARWILWLILLIIPLCLAAATVINLATQVTGVLPIANGGTNTSSTLTGLVRGGSALTASELSGDVTTSGSNAATIAASAVTASKADVTVKGYATAGAGLLNPAATTDTKLAEISLSAGYLNSSNKALDIFSHVVVVSGTTQTPTYTLKLKLCTVSGCGSGTVLTLVTFGATGAMTASNTVHAELHMQLMTTTTGSSGVVEPAGMGVLNITTVGTGGVIWNDLNNAGSSTIDLTAALFLDVMGQISTQSGTKNSMQARLTTARPVN
jgi:hypothetical protein